MSKQNLTTVLGIIIAFTFFSCSAPNYLSGPIIQYPIKRNICSFSVQNMDESAKVNNNTLSCQYEGFNVNYVILNDYVVSLVIENNSNKSLIIDKSKCYVLYNGYSTDLFKDVRSSRSTTYNNVQDAINNVQTNEGGVSMSIPPYSKWELPLNETNVRQIKELPPFNTKTGTHSLSPFDSPENVEYVIPYTYDYALAKWQTCRNRIYVSSIEVQDLTTTNFQEYEDDIYPRWLSTNQYKLTRKNGMPDYTEANRIDDINLKKFKKHNAMVTLSHVFWMIPTMGLSLISPGCEFHKPILYGERKSQNAEY